MEQSEDAAHFTAACVALSCIGDMLIYLIGINLSDIYTNQTLLFRCLGKLRRLRSLDDFHFIRRGLTGGLAMFT